MLVLTVCRKVNLNLKAAKFAVMTLKHIPSLFASSNPKRLSEADETT